MIDTINKSRGICGWSRDNYTLDSTIKMCRGFVDIIKSPCAFYYNFCTIISKIDFLNVSSADDLDILLFSNTDLVFANLGNFAFFCE